MTTKEAVETIKIAIAEVEWNYPLDYSIAFEKAIEALEKQMPKKPYDVDTEYKTFDCPECYQNSIQTMICKIAVIAPCVDRL